MLRVEDNILTFAFEAMFSLSVLVVKQCLLPHCSSERTRVKNSCYLFGSLTL